MTLGENTQPNRQLPHGTTPQFPDGLRGIDHAAGVPAGFNAGLLAVNPGALLFGEQLGLPP